MRKGQSVENNASQITFLPPEDAEFIHRGRVALAELVAVYEARRDKRLAEAPRIINPTDVFEFFRFEMEHLVQEQMHVLNLDRKSRVISAPLVYQGSLHTTVIRVAELFRGAILDDANSIIICHNHPSGDPTASPVIWRK